MYKFKSLTLLSAICWFFSSCYVMRPVTENQNNITEHLTLKIDQIEEGSSIGTGGGSYMAGKGQKFVFVFVTIKNNSEQTQKLDFENFYLLDTVGKTKRKVESVMMTSAINLWGATDSSVKANDKKSRKIVFTFPKEQIPSLLLINDNVISIPYSK